jgi:hypothetical protein
LLKDEEINHVKQQPIITIADDRRQAWSRARARVQGDTPPDTPHFLLADGIYENEYVRENGRWKIRGVTVTMTFYVEFGAGEDLVSVGPAERSHAS